MITQTALRTMGITLILLAMVGCASMIKQTITEDTEHGRKVTKTVVRAPKQSLNNSSLTTTGGVVTAVLSGAQSEADIQKVKGNTRNKGLMYGACGLVLLLGVVALAMPNALVSNKDGLIICGVGVGAFAIVHWAETAGPIMAWVLPLIIVGGAVYLGWLWFRKQDSRP